MGLLQRSNTQQPHGRRLIKKDERAFYEHDAKSSVHIQAKDANPARETILPLQRSQTALSHERPRTAGADFAGGQSRRRAATNHGVDLEIEIPLPTMEYKEGSRLYIFPTPSPRRPPLRSATFESSPSSLRNLAPDTPLIGVALGSPSQAPAPSGANKLAPVERVSSRTPSPLPPSRLPPIVPEDLPVEQSSQPTKDGKLAPANSQDKLRRRKSTWKTFGSILGLRSSKTAAAELATREAKEADKQPSMKTLQPPQQSTLHAPSPSSSSAISFNNPILATIPHSPSISRSMIRLEARADADRANLVPAGHPEPDINPIKPHTHTHDLYLRSFTDAQEQVAATETKRTLEQQFQGPEPVGPTTEHSPTPQLLVDFPDSSMDRYSVMFENLLEHKPSKPSHIPQRVPTLLERRQSKKQQNLSLEPVETGSTASTTVRPPGIPPQRSRTSPHPTRTSSLSVRVHDSNSNTSNWKKTSATPTHAQRPRNMKRANTAPSSAGLTFSGQPLPVPASEQQQSSPNTVDASLPPTPEIIDGNARDEITIVTGETHAQARPLHQQAWDFDLATTTPATKTAAAAAAKPFQLPPNPLNQHPPTPSLFDGPDDVAVRIIPEWKGLPPVKNADQIVQLSVARQISVSSARPGSAKGVSVGPRKVDLGGKPRKKKNEPAIFELEA